MFTTVKRVYRKAKYKWMSMTGLGKVKAVLEGMAAFGIGWMAADLVDDKHGPIVTACTYVGATGLAAGGAILAGEAISATIDSWQEITRDDTAEDAAQEEAKND